MTEKRKKWFGSKPDACDVCGRKPTPYFVDGRLAGAHTWALMCPECFKALGVGLGTGKGQKYDSKTLEKLEG